MSNKVTKSELDEIQSGKSKARKYTNGKVTVFWKPGLCIHSADCLLGLPEVFNNARKPWIDMKAASTEAIIRTVNTCPTRALTFIRNRQLNEPVKKIVKKKKPGNAQLQILKNGPILLTGNFIIFDTEKKKIKVITETVALCRCGVSKTKPFCDGHHLAVKFEG